MQNKKILFVGSLRRLVNYFYDFEIINIIFILLFPSQDQ